MRPVTAPTMSTRSFSVRLKPKVSTATSRYAGLHHYTKGSICVMVYHHRTKQLSSTHALACLLSPRLPRLLCAVTTVYDRVLCVYVVTQRLHHHYADTSSVLALEQVLWKVAVAPSHQYLCSSTTVAAQQRLQPDCHHLQRCTVCL